MDSQTYWKNRESEQRKHDIRDEREYQRHIEEIYQNMIDEIEKEINGFYGKYARKEGITMAEAKKRAAKLDIEAYGRKASKYVKEKNFSKQANEEMRLYNLTMKVNRLELLKAQIGLEMVAGFDELQKYFDEKLTDRTIAEFERQAGILGKTIQDNAKAANAIVNASFHNATYSDRIWMYQNMLKNELSSLLQTGLIQGQHPRKLATHLRKRFGVSQSNAERLLTTELRRVQTEAAKQSYQNNGNAEYKFLAINPMGACPVCKALDGKVFSVEKMMPGTNAPPMHPRCHCATAPYWDEEEFSAWLEADTDLEFAEWNKLKRKSSLKEDDDYQKRIKQRQAAYRNRTQSRSVSSNISDFSSMGREELLDYAKKNLKTDIGDLKGANIEFARDAIRVLSEFERKMGGNTINGLKVRFGGLSKSAYAKYDDATKTILLKKSGSKEAFEKAQKEENARYRAKWKRDKDYHATDTYTGTIWHELGHAIDIESNQSLSKRLSSTPELDELSVKISNYAGTTQGVRVSKRSEAWAENFAAYMDGGTNKVKVPKEISDMIENYFKESVAKASGSGIIKARKESAYEGIPRSWKKIEGSVDSLRAVNPKYSSGNEAYTKNCTNCISAYEMRKRGYNVTARPATKNHYLSKYPEEAWIGADVQKTTGTGLEDIMNASESWPDGARAEIAVTWRGGNRGHVFVAEKVNGGIRFYDVQSGERVSSKQFSFVEENKTTFWRIDNLEPSDRGITACEEGD